MDKRVKNGAFAILLRHKRATPRVDVTVMTRTRIYEKYHNVGWRNKKLRPLSNPAFLFNCSRPSIMHSSVRSTGRCAVINRDAMQTTSKMCKAEFFPDESSLPWDTLAMAAVLHPLPKHASQRRCGIRFHPRQALYLRFISVGRKDLVYHVLFNFHSYA